MPLCGSAFCGCAITSVAADFADINGAYPTIDVAGNGTGASPWILTLNDEWAVPVSQGGLGVVGYARVTGSSTTSGVGLVDLVGGSVTFTAIAGRRYRATAIVQASKTVGSDALTVYLEESGVATLQLSAQYGASSTSPAKQTFVIEYVTNASISGSKTWGLRWSRTIGSGTISVPLEDFQPSTLTVEDIGRLP